MASGNVLDDKFAIVAWLIVGSKQKQKLLRVVLLGENHSQSLEPASPLLQLARTRHLPMASIGIGHTACSAGHGMALQTSLQLSYLCIWIAT